MSDTPRTDDYYENVIGKYGQDYPSPSNFARQLEREIAVLREERDRMAGTIAKVAAQRDQANRKLGELVAAVRVNFLHGTFTGATVEQVGKWLKQWEPEPYQPGSQA